jgi:hypothetical protein
MKQPSVKDSWAAVIQDIYDEEIDTNLLDSEEIDNLQETEENIDPQNSQQAQSFNYSAIDHVAMGLDVTIDQEAAMDQRILNVITNWSTANHPKIAVWPHPIPQLTKAYKMEIKYFFMYIFCIFFASFCFFFMYEYVLHLSNNTNKHLI